MKLANPLKSHEIAGRSYQFGRLTIGIGVEVEAYLATLPREIEQVESAGILKSIPPEDAKSIVTEMLARHDVYPPDAITAIHQWKHLLNAKFCKVMVAAALRQYNPGLTPEQIESIASSATLKEAGDIAITLLGLGDIDPKELAVPEVEAAKVAS